MQIANRSQAWRAVLVQFAATLTLSALIVLVSKDHAISALAGGMIATIANMFFSIWVFADYRAQQPGRLLARLYGAEIAKLVLVGILFAGAVQLIDPLSGGALFGAFLCIHFVPGLMSLLN